MIWVVLAMGLFLAGVLVYTLLWMREVRHRVDLNWKVLQGLVREMGKQAISLKEYKEEVERWLKS